MADTVTIGGVDFLIRADGSQAGKELVRTEQRAKNAANTMVREFDRADRSADRLASTLRRSTSSLALFGAGFSGAVLVRGLIDAADTMQLLRGRIANVVTEGESLNRVMRDLFDASQANRQSLEATAQLYLRLRNSIQGLNHETALQISSTFSKTLILSGASASEAAASMLQFAQAMGSGRLQGDELRSLLENNTRFAKALSASLGVAVGDLKALGEAGALTTDLVTKAVLESSAVIDSEFSNVPLTIGQAFQQLQNGLLMYVSQIDSSYGVSQRVAKGIELLTQNVAELGNALLILGAGGATYAALRGLQALGARAAIFGDQILAAVGAFNMKNDPRMKSGLATMLNQQATALIQSMDNLEHAQRRVLDLEAAFEREKNAAFLSGEKPNRQRYQQQMEQARSLAVNANAVKMSAERDYQAIQEKMNAVGEAGGHMANRLKGAGAAIVNFFGGPLGVAILAAASAMAVLTAQSIEYERVSRSIANGQELLASLNVLVSDSAAEAAGRTKELAEATKVQAEAVKALAAAKREQLRVDLQQAAQDARTRIADLQRLSQGAMIAAAAGAVNADDITGQTNQAYVPTPQTAEVQKRTAEMQRLAILADNLDKAIAGIDAGVLGLASDTSKVSTEAEKALKAFQDVVDLQRKSTTPAAFKSEIIKNSLGKLAETDLAEARKQFGSVRDLLSDADANAVTANFRKITKSTVDLKSALSEYQTPAEKFAQSLKDIANADPSEGNKSRARVQAIVDYGAAIKDLPAAMQAIDGLGKLLTPEDAALAKQLLREVAEEATRSVGGEASQAIADYNAALKELNQTEAALIATKVAYDPAQYAAARQTLYRELLGNLSDAATSPAQDAVLKQLEELITGTLTPVEKLNAELTTLAKLREGAAAGSQVAVAADRKRIQLLVDEARATGYAADALAKLKALQASAGYSNAEIRGFGKQITAAAQEGRSGLKAGELNSGQIREQAVTTFSESFRDGLLNAIRSGDVGQAFTDVLAQRATEALADSFLNIGEVIGGSLFGENGILGGTIQGLMGGGQSSTTSPASELGTAAAEAASQLDIFSLITGGQAVAGATASSAADLTQSLAATTATGAMVLLSAAATAATAALLTVAASSAASSASDGIGALLSMSASIPGAAHGGPATAGQPMWVGETGKREVFIPGADGYIVPDSALTGAGRVRGGAKAGPSLGIRMGDTIVQGDASENTLLLIRQENMRAAQGLERRVRVIIQERNRRT